MTAPGLHTLTVDLANKSAHLTTPGGELVSAWSGVTRRTALDCAHYDGWVKVTEWEWTTPPDGFYCHLVYCP